MTDHQLSPDGLLIIDKPAAWTSHDVVAKARKLCRTKRIGHTGTLDPFATGVLVLCLNRATRLVQYLTGEDKEYIATVRFGFATDTGDLTGQPLQKTVSAAHLNQAIVADALAQFRGTIQQIPPMYSAKKIGGVKLYEMARRGEAIERQPIQIEIKTLELLPDTVAQGDYFDCTLRVVCSSGTYIRTLAEDIGKALGIGAHLIALRRTRAGNCQLQHALKLEQLEALTTTGNWQTSLRTMISALTFPVIQITAAEKDLLKNGRPIKSTESLIAAEFVQLTYQSTLVAIAAAKTSESLYVPRQVFI